MMALWPGDDSGLHFSPEDCTLVAELVQQTGLRDKSVEDLLAAAKGTATSKGQLSRAQYFGLIRRLAPGVRDHVSAAQRGRFSGVLSRLFNLYDWAGEGQVQAQVSCRTTPTMHAAPPHT